MEILEKIAKFIQDSQKTPFKSKWLSDKLMEVYIRHGRKVLVHGKGIQQTFDIANVTVYKKSKGTWTNFIGKVHAINPFDATYVECVHNERLASWLIRNNWLRAANCSISYFLPKGEWHVLQTNQEHSLRNSLSWQ